MKPGALVAEKYRIVRKLGEGGMGSVWLAKNEVTERELAIKFLHASKERTADQLKRFFQEAKVAGKLRHPAIVEIFDAGSEPTLDGAPYLVMELLDGVPLDEAIRRAGALPLGVSLEILLTVSRALALAHDKGIIHRDLKPSNVFLHRVGDGSAVAKVLDFGISKVLVDDATGRQVTGMTRTGAVLGSPLYMSPEQAAGDKSIDARSDVHALGVLLWECLVGRPPFVSDTYGLLLVEIIQGERPVLSSVLSSVPPSISRLVSRAIARQRAQRWADAGQLAEAIEAELAALGHVPMLAGRHGARDVFALLGSDQSAGTLTASSTTAAVEVPTSTTPDTERAPDSSDDAAAPAASVADEPARRRPGVSDLAPRARPPLATDTAPVTPRRTPWLGLAGAGAALLVVTVAGISLMRAGASASAPSAEPTGAAPIETAVGAAPTPGPAPSVAPTLAAEAPDAAPDAAPENEMAKAPPPTPKPAAVKPKSVARPPAAAKPAAAAPKPSAAPVHHGVTSSGL